MTAPVPAWSAAAQTSAASAGSARTPVLVFASSCAHQSCVVVVVLLPGSHTHPHLCAPLAAHRRSCSCPLTSLLVCAAGHLHCAQGDGAAGHRLATLLEGGGPPAGCVCVRGGGLRRPSVLALSRRFSSAVHLCMVYTCCSFPQLLNAQPPSLCHQPSLHLPAPQRSCRHPAPPPCNPTLTHRFPASRPSSRLQPHPHTQIPGIKAIIPRQRKALEAVELIRATTSDLIRKCKEVGVWVCVAVEIPFPFLPFHGTTPTRCSPTWHWSKPNPTPTPTSTQLNPNLNPPQPRPNLARTQLIPAYGG